MTTLGDEAAGPWEELRQGLEREDVPLLGRLAVRALEVARLPAGAAVLQVDAGPGTLVPLLAGRFGEVVLAEDWPSEHEALRAEVASLDLRHVEVLRAPAERLPLPRERFDAALWALPLHLKIDRTAAFREVRRVLRPDCPLVVIAWEPPRVTGTAGEAPSWVVAQLSAAGLGGVAVHEVRHELRAPSEIAWMKAVTAKALARTPERRAFYLRLAEKHAAREVAEPTTGPVALTCTAFIVIASRPAPAHDLDKN